MGGGYAKNLDADIRCGDFFLISQRGGSVLGGEVPFIGLLLKTTHSREEVTVGGRVMVEGVVLGDGGGGGGGGEGVEGGDGGGAVFFLFQIYMDVSGTHSQHIRVPPIPYEIYSHSYGMGEVVSTNLGMWCRGECVGGVAFIQHVRGIQHGFPLFGGKGVHNSFCLHTHVCFNSYSFV